MCTANQIVHRCFSSLSRFWINSRSESKVSRKVKNGTVNTCKYRVQISQSSPPLDCSLGLQFQASWNPDGHPPHVTGAQRYWAALYRSWRSLSSWHHLPGETWKWVWWQTSEIQLQYVKHLMNQCSRNPQGLRASNWGCGLVISMVPGLSKSQSTTWSPKTQLIHVRHSAKLWFFRQNSAEFRSMRQENWVWTDVPHGWLKDSRTIESATMERHGKQPIRPH